MKNVHRVIKFNETAWLKPYIDTNTDPKKANNDFEKDSFRLMNNAVFGKTLENMRKYRDIKVGLSYSKKKCFIEDSLKMMKNAFYFNLKALFLFKTFSFLSRFSVMQEKWLG